MSGKIPVKCFSYVKKKPNERKIRQNTVECYIFLIKLRNACIVSLCVVFKIKKKFLLKNLTTINHPSIHPYVIVIIGNEVKLNLQIELSYLSLLRLMFVLTHYTLVSVGVVHSLQCNNMILVEFSCIP